LQIAPLPASDAAAVKWSATPSAVTRLSAAAAAAAAAAGHGRG